MITLNALVMTAETTLEDMWTIYGKATMPPPVWENPDGIQYRSLKAVFFASFTMALGLVRQGEVNLTAEQMTAMVTRLTEEGIAHQFKMVDYLKARAEAKGRGFAA